MNKAGSVDFFSPQEKKSLVVKCETPWRGMFETKSCVYACMCICNRVLPHHLTSCPHARCWWDKLWIYNDCGKDFKEVTEDD